MLVFTTRNAVLVALMQVGVIFAAVLGSGLAVRLHESGGEAAPALPGWIARYGLLLAAVPLAWLYLALRLRRDPETSDAKKAWAFIAGLGLAGALVWLTFLSGVRPTFDWLTAPPPLPPGESGM